MFQCVGVSVCLNTKVLDNFPKFVGGGRLNSKSYLISLGSFELFLGSFKVFLGGTFKGVQNGGEGEGVKATFWKYPKGSRFF